jgi:hypothetical protein
MGSSGKDLIVIECGCFLTGTGNTSYHGPARQKQDDLILRSQIVPDTGASATTPRSLKAQIGERGISRI